MTVLTVVLALPALTSIVYWLLSGVWLRRWLAEPVPDAAGDIPPVTFFRPLKSGVPELAAKLELLARALRAGDQLLLGVEPGSVEAGVAETLQADFPQREILVVLCVPGVAANPKISKLLQMEPLARHEHWILSDSEALLEGEFLAAFRQEWTTCDVLTAGYRFTGARTWPQQLDGAAVLLTLWPALATLRAHGRSQLTLGACTGFRRSDLKAVGGWTAFGEELAEDHQLGVALATVGKAIRLSRSVVTLDCDPLSWREYWRHQRRVAITYRVANPAGFAWAWLTQGVTSSLLLATWRAGEVWPWMLFVLVFVMRGVTACATVFPLPRFWLTLLPASLVESACWALSWVSRVVWWGGVRWRLTHTGKLRRADER
jgi:ceramide glucosyltransferase